MVVYWLIVNLSCSTSLCWLVLRPRAQLAQIKCLAYLSQVLALVCLFGLFGMLGQVGLFDVVDLFGLFRPGAQPIRDVLPHCQFVMFFLVQPVRTRSSACSGCSTMFGLFDLFGPSARLVRYVLPCLVCSAYSACLGPSAQPVRDVPPCHPSHTKYLACTDQVSGLWGLFFYVRT